VEQAFDPSFVTFDDGETVEASPLRVTPHEVVHPSGAPSFALRGTVDGTTVAYSGDTEWTDALAVPIRFSVSRTPTRKGSRTT